MVSAAGLSANVRKSCCFVGRLRSAQVGARSTRALFISCPKGTALSADRQALTCLPFCAGSGLSAYDRARWRRPDVQSVDHYPDLRLRAGGKRPTIRGGQAMYLLGSREAAVDSRTRNHGQPGEATPTGGAKAIRESD